MSAVEGHYYSAEGPEMNMKDETGLGLAVY